MTLYARPGTTGSIITRNNGYENLIGGDCVWPLESDCAEDLAPATGLPIAKYARPTVGDVDAAVAAAHAAVPVGAAT